MALLTTTFMRAFSAPLLAALFWILPVKVSPKSLLKLAFVLWIIGGGMLLVTGAGRLGGVDPNITSPSFMVGLTIAVAIGLAKGKFILSKTSARNIARINEFNGEPQSLFKVYSLRSWIVIELMLLLSAALTFFGAPMLVRGYVNIAVGVGLIISSLQYLSAIGCCAADNTNPVAN